ncbi:MAG: nickel pincer cofactor biosynthesis protein LarC [Chitinivibrionales bacterium]|nr:nickel pincer cofactor biosynthesis protein LarC [Chitinivibrionales bacterium]MBD3394159.1 nickel pincer cofactor biosynthesis protein LarC [Chitinivibrionales bacterium]
MHVVYFQTLCGASGDMILSSLLDLGVPVSHLAKQLARMKIDGLQVNAEKTTRGGIACTRVAISCGEQKTWRHLPDILACIRAGGYPSKVEGMAGRVLTRLGEAEARVHGISLDQVHFHEVGAVDTIVDVLGTCLCLEYLGVEKVLFSELSVGHGSIETAHGILPVPAPATARLLEGFAARTIDIPTEILTPTGAALLTTLGEQAVCMPAGTVRRIGYGSGERSFAGRPNALRAVLSDIAAPEEAHHDRVCILESDMDHISGEVMAFAAEELMRIGALDVSWTPVFMKKGRPGYRLCVMGRQDDLATLADCMIAQTRTLGVRYRTTDRIIASRAAASLAIDGAAVDAKHCAYKGRSFTKAEYESLASLAREKDVPLLDLIERVPHKKK